MKHRPLMKLSTTTILLFLFSANVFSQNIQLSGKITNEQNKPLSFTNVLLVAKDSTVQQTFTNDSGKFILNAPQGSYVLLIKQLNDTLYLLPNIDLTHNMDLGTLTVQKERILKEVTVTSQKPLVERKIDRLVFNTADMPSVAGGDVLDILKITPLVTVSDNDISIFTKKSVGVLINDRLVTMSGADLVNFLRSLRAGDVERIEVITTPPARYDAGGAGGLINIVMKKAANNTWNGSVTGVYQQASYPLGALAGSFNYSKNKLSFYASASYQKGKSGGEDESKIYYPALLWRADDTYKNNSNALSPRAGFDANITKSWTLGAGYIGSYSRPKSSTTGITSLSNLPDNTNAGNIFTQNNSSTKANTNSGNAHSIFKLDTLGRVLSIDFDVLNYKKNINRNYTSTTTGSQITTVPDGLIEQTSPANTNITNYSVQIDMQHPIKKFSLNYGAKFSFSKTNNDIHTYDVATGALITDSGQTNTFRYKENTQAFYISGNTKFGKNNKWQAQAGLRAENTQWNGYSVTLNETYKNSYLQFFPTAYLEYSPNDKNDWSIEYSRRISRPGFSALDPFRFYLSPYYYTQGNPELQPSYTTNIQLSYTYNNVLVAGLSYSMDKNNSGQVVIPQDSNYIQAALRLNYFDNYSYGAYVVYTYNKLKWWTSRSNIFGYYQRSNSKIYPVTPKNMEGYGAIFSTNNTFHLDKKQNVSTGFTFQYRVPANSSDLVYNYGRAELDIFAQILFLKKKLSVTLAGNNLTKADAFNNKSTRAGNLTYMKGFYDDRYFRLTASYRFGSNKVNVRQRNTSNQDERNRMN